MKQQIKYFNVGVKANKQNNVIDINVDLNDPYIFKIHKIKDRDRYNTVDKNGNEIFGTDYTDEFTDVILINKLDFIIGENVYVAIELKNNTVITRLSTNNVYIT